MACGAANPSLDWAREMSFGWSIKSERLQSSMHLTSLGSIGKKVQLQHVVDMQRVNEYMDGASKLNLIGPRSMKNRRISRHLLPT